MNLRNYAATYKPQRTQTIKKGNYKPRPFWLPASNYYILAAAAAIACFFFFWWILREGGEEIPYVPAGMAASILLGSAVFLREVILRKARRKYLTTQKMLDHNLRKVGKFTNVNVPRKLSIAQNAAIIEQIVRKSDAAMVLEKLSEGHWEVFELCNEYLHRTKVELQNVGVGSPRLAAFRRSREIVKRLHRKHLLNWAENESRINIKNAKNQIAVAEKLEYTQKALVILDTAFEFYPQEYQLRDSIEAVKEFNSSIKISHFIEQAERSAYKGDKAEALNFYQDALFYLQKEHIQNDDRERIESNVVAEMKKIEQNLKLKAD